MSGNLRDSERRKKDGPKQANRTAVFFNCARLIKCNFLQPVCNGPLGNTFYYRLGCLLVNKFMSFEDKHSNPRYKFIKIVIVLGDYKRK